MTRLALPLKVAAMRTFLAVGCLFVGACQCSNQIQVREQRGSDAGVDGGLFDAGAGGGAAGGSTAGGAGGGFTATCTDGDPCGDGGVCAGGSCCAASSACGSTCCSVGSTCSFQRCLAPGSACRDSADCAPTEFCDLANAQPIAADGGACLATPPQGRCLPTPPACPPDAGAAAGRSCLESCRFTRSAQTFRPVVKYSWGDPTPPYASDVMMAPIVTQLGDDDCDGRITAQDQPDIVVVTFTAGAYTQIGVVHALTVRGGALRETWSRPGVIFAGSQLASGEIDGQPGNEVVGCGMTGPVLLRGDGSVAWTAQGNSCTTLSIADLDGDGRVEVITETQVFDGRTGALELVLPFGANTVAADVDGDGVQDLVSAADIATLDGGFLARVTGPAGFVAIGDLDKNGRADIVSVNSSTHRLAVWTYDPTAPTKGTLVRTGIDINATLSPSLCAAGSSGNIGGGGPPTLGDFNGDGFPDVALAGGVGYAVFDGKKLMDGVTPAEQTLLWIRQTQDCSSAATGSTLFDFDGDGRVEVVYGDEVNLHVYDSATGNELFTTCNTSGTLIEYPLVADVDNDGQADLIVVANAYAFACPGAPTTARFSGVRVFGSADDNWVVTRRVWNQHAYSVTNIEEDGAVPRQPARNWTVPGLNNFRQNKQPGLEFAAADAVVSVTGACVSDGVSYRITVRNIGEATLPAGIRVELVENPGATPTVLTSFTTTRSLGPTQAETFSWSTTQPLGATPVVARIMAGAVRECRVDNNTSSPPTFGCIN